MGKKAIVLDPCRLSYHWNGDDTFVDTGATKYLQDFCGFPMNCGIQDDQILKENGTKKPAIIKPGSVFLVSS